jgi:periplasmic protein TonB
MVCGSALVFATVLSMNLQKKPPKEEDNQATVAFKVEKKPPKKKKTRRKPASRPRQQRAATAPKAPDLSSAISGVSLEFSGVGNFAVATASDDLIGKIDKKGPMTEGALDNPPKLKSRRGNQEYPEDARKSGVEGYVTLNIYVRSDGSVGSVKVLDSKPSGVFDASAKEFVREWMFSPGSYEGESVDAWVKQRIRYQLQKS